MAHVVGYIGKVYAGVTEMDTTGYDFEDTVGDVDTTTTTGEGWENSIGGTRRCKGTVNCIYNTTKRPTASPPGLTPRSSVTLKLYTETSGYYQITALILSLKYKNEVKGKVEYSFEFTSQGEVTIT